MFWVGGGVSLVHGVHTLVEGNPTLHVGWENWAVLGVSLGVDGTVLAVTARELMARAKAATPDLFASSRWRAVAHHLRTSSDPFLTAVALEDLVACAGAGIAAIATGVTHMTGWQWCDSVGSIGIGGMLAAAAVFLVRLNYSFALGRSIDQGTVADIRSIIAAYPSVEAVQSVSAQWLSPTTFSVTARVDFDGTALAARLHAAYDDLFKRAPADDLPVLLSFFAEDVTRLVEAEVEAVEAAIRAAHPSATIIDLEPASEDSGRFIYRTIRKAWVQQSSDEAEQVLAEHLAMLQRQAEARPGDASTLRSQEERIRSWYERRKARTAASVAGAPRPAGD